jgi:hypothetical protein
MADDIACGHSAHIRDSLGFHTERIKHPGCDFDLQRFPEFMELQDRRGNARPGLDLFAQH